MAKEPKGVDGKAVDADREHNPIHGGSNLAALKNEVKLGVDQIVKLKEERSAINDKIGEVRSALAAKSIPKKALDMAMSYMNMDPDKREGFDIAYQIVREAINLPIDGQGDLFDGKKEGAKE